MLAAAAAAADDDDIVRRDEVGLICRALSVMKEFMVSDNGNSLGHQ